MAFREKLACLLSIKDSPRKIALSFAVGVFFGMSPLLGLHTVLGLAAAFLFRLNKFATIVGVYVTNPWTIVPIYSFATWAGAWILGIDKIIPDINWNEITFSSFMNEIQPLLWPFVFGTTLCGFVSGLVGYIIVHRAITLRRKK